MVVYTLVLGLVGGTQGAAHISVGGVPETFYHEDGDLNIGAILQVHASSDGVCTDVIQTRRIQYVEAIR